MRNCQVLGVRHYCVSGGVAKLLWVWFFMVRSQLYYLYCKTVEWFVIFVVGLGVGCYSNVIGFDWFNILMKACAFT